MTKRKPASEVTLYDIVEAYCNLRIKQLRSLQEQLNASNQSAPADTTAAERSARAASHALGEAR
jgi:hypothetical protein